MRDIVDHQVGCKPATYAKTEKYANAEVKYISRRPTLYVENLNKYQNKGQQ